MKEISYELWSEIIPSSSRLQKELVDQGGAWSRQMQPSTLVEVVPEEIQHFYHQSVLDCLRLRIGGIRHLCQYRNIERDISPLRDYMFELGITWEDLKTSEDEIQKMVHLGYTNSAWNALFNARYRGVSKFDFSYEYHEDVSLYINMLNNFAVKAQLSLEYFGTNEQELASLLHKAKVALAQKLAEVIVDPDVSMGRYGEIQITSFYQLLEKEVSPEELSITLPVITESINRYRIETVHKIVEIIENKLWPKDGTAGIDWEIMGYFREVWQIIDSKLSFDVVEISPQQLKGLRLKSYAANARIYLQKCRNWFTTGVGMMSVPDNLKAFEKYTGLAGDEIYEPIDADEIRKMYLASARWALRDLYRLRILRISLKDEVDHIWICLKSVNAKPKEIGTSRMELKFFQVLGSVIDFLRKKLKVRTESDLVFGIINNIIHTNDGGSSDWKIAHQKCEAEVIDFEKKAGV